MAHVQDKALEGSHQTHPPGSLSEPYPSGSLSPTAPARVSSASTMPLSTSSTCVDNSAGDQTKAMDSSPPKVVQGDEHHCTSLPSHANICPERNADCAKSRFPTSESTQIPSVTEPAQSDSDVALSSRMHRELSMQAAEKTENEKVKESLSPKASAGSSKAGSGSSSKSGEDDSTESDWGEESSHGQDRNMCSEAKSHQKVTHLLNAPHDVPVESDESGQPPEIVAEQAAKSSDESESEDDVEQDADEDFEQEDIESDHEKYFDDGSEEQGSSDNSHIGSAQEAAFPSQQDPDEEAEITSFNQQPSEDYPEDNSLQSAIYPAFSTSLITRDSFNFPTGAELLGGPTHRQNKEYPPRAPSLPNDTGIHQDDGLLGNTGGIVRYHHQNVVRRLGYDDPPPSNEIWTNMAAQYVGSSVLDSGGNSCNPEGISTLADNQGPLSSTLSSENIQESYFNQGESLSRAARGQSPFSPEAPQMQTEALHLCLNPTFGAPGADSDFSALGMNLMMVPNTGSGVDQLARNSPSPQSSNQQQLVNIPISLATMVQTALAQRSHMHLPASQDLGLADAVPGPHFFGNPESTDWQNGGNELTFFPGCDSIMHTQPFPVQLSAQAHHPAPELAEAHMYASNGRAPPPLSAINPIFPQSVFQNGDGHEQSPTAVANFQLQGLSLSLSPHQPPLFQIHPAASNHGPSEAATAGIHQDEPQEALSARPQARASADAKGKRVVADDDEDNGEHSEPFRSRSPPQRLVPIPDPGVAFAVAVIGRAFGLKNYGLYAEGEQYPAENSGNDPFPASSSRPRVLYGSDGTFPKLFQALLIQLCTAVRVGGAASNDHDRIQATSSRTQLPFSTSTPSGSEEQNVPLTFADLQRNARAANAMREEDYKGRGKAPYGRRETRESLEKKKVTLMAYIPEIDGRKKAYHARMMEIVNRFNSVAGPSFAETYTASTLQAVSKQFRSLRAFVIVHLKQIKGQLGEQVTHNLQRTHSMAMQQMGIPQQMAWRPQRGLPERAVMVLRSWLFQSFLHPYPGDPDKVYLARQTGLTRNQVSNWFINARVRLWKPMVEELYIDEFGPIGPNGLGIRDIRGGYQPPAAEEIENVNMEHEDLDANVDSDSEVIYGAPRSENLYQMIQVTAAGGGVRPYVQANIGSTSASVPAQNSSADHRNYVAFDAEQREASTLKRARSENGMHRVENNYPIHSRPPITNMDSTVPFHDNVDPSGGSFYGGSEDQVYGQHHGMLTPSNAERFGIFLPAGENFSTYPAPGAGFLPSSRHLRFTNGGVSLTLGLPNVPAPHQSYPGNQLNHLLQVPNETAAAHQFNAGIPSEALRIADMNVVQDNGSQFLPLAHLNSQAGELDREISPLHLSRQTNRIPNHMLQQLAAQEQLLLQSTRRPEPEQISLGSLIQSRDEYPGDGSLASVIQDRERIEHSTNESSSNNASTSGSPGMQM